MNNLISMNNYSLNNLAFARSQIFLQNTKKSTNIQKNSKKFINTLRSMQTGAQNYDGVRIGPPPDLPSLLLHNRIVYVGMPLVPAVTELIVAEFYICNTKTQTNQFSCI